MQDSYSRSEGKSGKEISWGKLHAHTDRVDDRTSYGGLGLAHQLARRLGFAEAIDEHVKVLKIHQGYRESDHLFHLVSILFAGGERIEDLKFLQSDEGYRKLMGDVKVTDPTTMGDFLRRFGRSDLNDFKSAIWCMRRQAWQRSGSKLPKNASIDLDSRICPVYGNQKAGADYSYKKTFSYHPEFVSLAETGEWLDVVNRPGNIVSGSSAAYLLRRVLPELSGFFASVCVRGDTKYGRTDLLDVCADHDAQVCVCWPANAPLVERAKALEESCWSGLDRKQNKPNESNRKKRRRGRNLRRQKARRRGYKDKKLKREWVAEFDYHPIQRKKAMARSYRMIVIRKQIQVAGKTGLFDDYSYRFILTDLQQSNLTRLVNYAYGRSHQENLIEQALNGVSAFRMPTGRSLANEAWMTAAMLAHNFKSWLCLLALGKDKLGWEWKRFRLAFVYVSTRITRAARQLHLWFAGNHPHATYLQTVMQRI